MKKLLILFMSSVCFGLHAQKNALNSISEKGIIALLELDKAYESQSIAVEKSNLNVTFGTFTDARDGKTYKTVKIGNQVWMAENLNYDTGMGSWAYDNNPKNAEIYGRLYNWEAAIKACPAGWHLPTEGDWTKLIDALGGIRITGGKIKVAGTAYWRSPNNGATNESGFSALPGGFRDQGGSFGYLGFSTYYWAADEEAITNYAFYRMLYFNNEQIDGRASFKDSGFSVRCIQD